MVMPQGLQVFDENGKCVVDVTDSLCRIEGKFQADKEFGSFTPSGLESTDRVFAYSSYSGRSEFSGGYVPLTIYITNGQTINWRYRTDVAANGMTEVITYGTY